MARWRWIRAWVALTVFLAGAAWLYMYRVSTIYNYVEPGVIVVSMQRST